MSSPRLSAFLFRFSLSLSVSMIPNDVKVLSHYVWVYIGNHKSALNVFIQLRFLLNNFVSLVAA